MHRRLIAGCVSAFFFPKVPKVFLASLQFPMFLDPPGSPGVNFFFLKVPTFLPVDPDSHNSSCPVPGFCPVTDVIFFKRPLRPAWREAAVNPFSMKVFFAYSTAFRCFYVRPFYEPRPSGLLACYVPPRSTPSAPPHPLPPLRS